MPDENISRHECVLYAFLDQDAAKKPVAARLVSNAIRAGNGFISLQVVNEFCNVMVKKSGKALSEILEATKLFGLFPMVDGSLRMTQRALEIRDLYDVQFYDALMLASSEAAGCEEILTEDLNDGQMYGSVRAVNPFKS